MMRAGAVSAPRMNNGGAVTPLLHTVDRACLVMGIGRTSVYKLISEGKLRTVRIAGRTLVPHASIEELLAGALEGAA